MKTKLILGLALVAMCSVLTGCDRTPVFRVKDMAWNHSGILTTAQALNTRAMCDSTSWKTLTDDRDRTVVEYHCQLKDIFTLFNKSAAEASPKGVVSGDEVIQWVVPDYQNDSPEITYIGREFNLHDGTVSSLRYNRPDAVMVAIADNSAKNLKEYEWQILMDAARIDHGE
jgi:hypothetical protein